MDELQLIQLLSPIIRFVQHRSKIRFLHHRMKSLFLSSSETPNLSSFHYLKIACCLREILFKGNMQLPHTSFQKMGVRVPPLKRQARSNFGFPFQIVLAVQCQECFPT
ncbi:unnamed protein product [Lathyrus sativus]|nr:unnamed protein product [Lathyrus sativus]